MDAEPQDPYARLVAARTAVTGRLASLRRQHDEIVSAAAQSNLDDEHDPEGATIAYERAQVQAFVDAAAAQLAAIELALSRIASGTYAACERCGAPIAAERLVARPEAATCVSCACTPTRLR